MVEIGGGVEMDDGIWNWKQALAVSLVDSDSRNGPGCLRNDRRAST